MGITLAREWAGREERVILLEGGGFEVTPEMQALYVNENSGREYYPLESARLHFFGGTTNHWDGFCAPFDPIDCQDRSWVPRSGWPITRQDLDPYYRLASHLTRVASENWNPDYWREHRLRAPLPTWVLLRPAPETQRSRKT